MTEANQPIVIDNGSSAIKTGFAGSDKPRVVLQSCIGRVKHTRVMPGGALEESDVYMGSKVVDHRGALILDYMMDHGMVRNWNDMEKLWSYIYSKDNLNAVSEEHAVLLTEAPLNPYSFRQKSSEIFFEGLNVPALYFGVQAILSLYASGRTTGVVLDIGAGVTQVVPVYEGLAIPNAVNRVDLGGDDINNYLQILLRRNGHVFTTSSEMEIVRQIKEKCCLVSFNPHEQELNTINIPYHLPDGQVINLSSETFRAPEILFKPDIIGSEYRGAHDSLVKSIMKTDIDLRKILFSQIVLAGGSTLFQGFGDRLLSEIRKHSSSPKDTKIRIAAPPERIYSTWIGGSILASLSTFKNMWVSKADYLEHGSNIFYQAKF